MTTSGLLLKGRAVTLVALTLLPLFAVSCDASLPPEAQVVVILDTDLPESLATRLRLDFFRGDGAWFASREVPRASARDWPASFGVVAPSSPSSGEVILRARVYPEGHVRDYRGERFTELGRSADVSGANGINLRLIVEGSDRTPSSEPSPEVTVDRLLRLAFRRDEKRFVRAVLRGVCAGTMARVAPTPTGIDPARVESCVDRIGVREALAPADPATAIALRASEVGEWAREPCEAMTTESPRVCAPGGAFLFGNARERLGAEFEPRERVVRVRRFYVDRREVTVSDYRDALSNGFAPPEPVRVTPGPLVADPLDGCVYTDVATDREALPLSCVAWDTAAAFCQHRGGELPTEAQWEYLATAAGRPHKTSFPWGDTEPSCDRASYGRAYLPPASGACQAVGSGPLPAGVPGGDRNPLGVLGLGGGVAEWMRDAAAPLDAACWTSSADDVWCATESERRSIRGGAWSAPAPLLRGSLRRSADARTRSASVGFRCVYGQP